MSEIPKTKDSNTCVHGNFLGNCEHCSFVENSDFTEMRRAERLLVGEDLNNGPGYKLCIRDYFAREIGGTGNQLLDLIATKRQLPRERIFVTIRDYNPIDPLGVVTREPLGQYLDIVVCENEDDAQRLRAEHPIILPYSFTQDAIQHVDPQKVDYPDVTHERESEDEKEKLRELLCQRFGVKRGDLALGLGSVEILRALFREHSQQIKNIKVAMPNYADVLDFAKKYGYDISEDDLNAGILYISTPNNPTGSAYTKEELCEIIGSCSRDIKILIDQSGIRLGDKHLQSKTPFLFDNDELRQQFPGMDITQVSSFSKIANLTTSRVGFATSTTPETVSRLVSAEPPIMETRLISDMLQTGELQTREQVIKKEAALFLEKLNQRALSSNTFSVRESAGPFVIVDFISDDEAEAYLERLKHYTFSVGEDSIPVTGLPKRGQGDTVKDGIIKLNSTSLRLSVLSHPNIIDALP